jgi:hypothetical protein
MSAPTQNAPNASDTGTPTTVEIYITASGGNAEIPEGTYFIYDNVQFTIDEAITVADGTTESVGFTANEVGAITIPANSVTSFANVIANVSNVTNAKSVEGLNKTAYKQEYITESGQSIDINYDKATNVQVFVKVVLAKGENNDSEQIRNQIKRDLISSSAEWVIGQDVTSLITSSPFINCSYAEVAYTLVSTDGETWGNRIETACNSIPHLSDSTIIIESLT